MNTSLDSASHLSATPNEFALGWNAMEAFNASVARPMNAEIVADFVASARQEKPAKPHFVASFWTALSVAGGRKAAAIA
ncbi:hypothetical protein GCM10023213_20730 [Prosthecobacter algae]|uniref:Uncharacterized protein n=1 Tax=Prosthecobacter algae TaxID=1144682 RepID=A0ABP9P3M6_9BACT